MNKKEQPIIETGRLVLRPYSRDDASELQRLIDNKDIALPTINIPHPYEDGMAEQWIQKSKEEFEKEEGVHFAIAHHEQHFFIGGIDLFNIDKQNEVVELGYWIGKPYWSQGYCTEAARAVIEYAFEMLKINRIQSKHFTRNPASGHVLQKISMKHEGTLREAFKKCGRFEDVECYGILREEYEKSN